MVFVRGYLVFVGCKAASCQFHLADRSKCLLLGSSSSNCQQVGYLVGVVVMAVFPLDNKERPCCKSTLSSSMKSILFHRCIVSVVLKDFYSLLVILVRPYVALYAV